jgi:hypothetical protein
VLVKRSGIVSAVSSTFPGSLLVAHNLPGTFPAAAGPLVVEASGMFDSTSAGPRTLSCAAVVNNEPLQPQNFVVAAMETHRAFRYVAVVSAKASDSVGFGCLADGSGVTTADVVMTALAAQNGTQAS